MSYLSLSPTLSPLSSRHSEPARQISLYDTRPEITVIELPSSPPWLSAQHRDDTTPQFYLMNEELRLDTQLRGVIITPRRQVRLQEANFIDPVESAHDRDAARFLQEVEHVDNSL